MCWPLEATRVHILKRKSTGEERQYLITHKIFIIFFKCMQCWHIGPNHFNVISMLLPIKMHIISAKNGQHGLKVAPLQAWTKRQVYPYLFDVKSSAIGQGLILPRVQMKVKSLQKES